MGKTFADGEAWAGEGAVTLTPGQQGVTAWRFEVAADGAAAGAIGGVSRLKLSATLETLPQGELLLRGDSVAFPPGGCAYLHRHQGPGIRCLIEGGIRIDTHGRSTSYGPGGAWYESGPDGVFAQGADGSHVAVRARDGVAARADREELDPVSERRGQGEAEVAVLQDLRRHPDRVPGILTHRSNAQQNKARAADAAQFFSNSIVDCSDLQQ